MPRVITKKSTVLGKVPVAADLEIGELAVNTADSKLYTKHNDNSIKDLTPVVSVNGMTGAVTVVNITGNSGTATKLAATKNIAGVAFDGSTNISIPFANLSSKPTTLAGYSISDAAPSSHVGSTGAAHGVATVSVNGFMSSTDKTKLDGVATSANNYVHPTQSAITSDNSNGVVLQDITVNTSGHVTAIGTFDLDTRYYTETESNTFLSGKQNYHGVQSIGAVTFNDTTHILSLASITYWYSGVQFTTASAVTCDIDSYATLTANTLYYFYFDASAGTLKCQTTAFNLYTQVPVAIVAWNGTAGAIMGEWHSHTREVGWHVNAHVTIGSRYGSGLALTNPTTANDALLSITGGVIYDEDLAVNIANPQTTMRGWRKVSASVYTFADYSLPYIGTSGQPQYLDTDTYTLTNVAASDFVCMWVYASNDITRPIYIIPTHASTAYNILSLARGESPPSLSGLNISPEMKLLYKFIYKGDGQFQESVDFRQTSSLPAGGTASTSASSVSFTPTGNIASVDVQNALAEIDAEKQPIDADLTAIAALSGTSGLLKKTAADTWSLDTGVYILTDDSRLSDARTPTAHNQAWSTITGTPTTLAGYGITDASTQQVFEYVSSANFPGTGAASTIYIDKTANLFYRWSGSAYVLIGTTPVTPDPSFASLSATMNEVSVQYFTIQNYDASADYTVENLNPTIVECERVGSALKVTTLSVASNTSGQVRIKSILPGHSTSSWSTLTVSVVNITFYADDAIQIVDFSAQGLYSSNWSLV